MAAQGAICQNMPLVATSHNGRSEANAPCNSVSHQHCAHQAAYNTALQMPCWIDINTRWEYMMTAGACAGDSVIVHPTFAIQTSVVVYTAASSLLS